MNMPAAIDKDSLIEVKLVDEVNTCPYVDWYKFKTCGVKTCKNWTSKTKSHCLAIDREAPTGNKVISDAEIHLFKFHKDGVSTRLVSMRRKKAVGKVKCILALHGFIEYIRTEHSAQRSKVFKHDLISEAEKSYPLKIKRLGFQNWMWAVMTSKKHYKLFASTGRGECAAFGLHELLDMDQQTVENLRRVVATIEDRD